MNRRQRIKDEVDTTCWYTRKYFTPVMFAHFVYALLGFCAHKFPAKSEKKNWDIFHWLHLLVQTGRVVNSIITMDGCIVRINIVGTCKLHLKKLTTVRTVYSVSLEVFVFKTLNFVLTKVALSLTCLFICMFIYACFNLVELLRYGNGTSYLLNYLNKKIY